MKNNRLYLNLIYRIFHQFVLLLVPLLITPYVSRKLGVEGIGIYSYYYSIVLYFSYFAMLGISSYGNRCIAKIKNNKRNINKTFTSIYCLQVITSILVIVIYLFYIYISDNKLVSSIMILFLFSLIFDVNWLWYGIQEIKIPLLIQIISRLVSLVMIFIFIDNYNDLWIYVLIKCLIDFIANFFIFLFSLKKIKFVKINFYDIKKHLKPCLILFIPVIAASIYQHLDKIMLGIFVDKIEVGYYEAANKLVVISLGIITAIHSVLFPKLSSYNGKNNKKQFNILFDKSFVFIMFIGIGLSFFIIGISKNFVPLFFGDSFIKSINLTRALSLIIIFISWSNSLRWLYLIPKENDSIYVKSVILGAIVNVIMNLLLIPLFSSFGAAYATILAELSVMLYQSFKVKENISFKLYLKDILIFLISGFIMMLSIFLISNFALSNFIAVVLEFFLGGLIYNFLIIFCFKNYILKDFINLLKS